MPKFSNSSLNVLGTAHRDLRTLFEYVILWFDCKAIHGLRTPGEQFELYKQGRKEINGKWMIQDSSKIVTYKDGFIKKSKHNYIPSLAVDVVPYYSEAPHIRWGDFNRIRYFAGFVIGVSKMLKECELIENEIITGMDWDGDTILTDQTMFDALHFQIK